MKERGRGHNGTNEDVYSARDARIMINKNIKVSRGLSPGEKFKDLGRVTGFYYRYQDSNSSESGISA